MSKQTAVTMNDINDNQLFILQGVGVLRKTGNCIGETKAGKVHVIYPNEQVSLLAPRKGAKQ